MRYARHVSHTPWPLLSCILIGGAMAGCSANKGPATGAYIRDCESACAGIPGQVRDMPKLPAPAKPSLPPNPTDEELRINNGMVKIYPLFVNQFYGAVFERCQALSQLYGQARDGLAAVKVDGVDSAAVQTMTLRQQAMGQRREVFAALGHLAAVSRDSLKRRHSADGLDDELAALMAASVDKLAGAGEFDAAAAGTLLDQLGAASGEASMREAGKDGVADEITRVNSAVAELKRDIAQSGSERSKLAADLKARYPGEDWGALQPVAASGKP
jgi:hypothetical protein